MALLNICACSLVLLGALKRPLTSLFQVLSVKSSIGTLCLHPLWVPYMSGNRNGGVLGENGVSLECDLITPLNTCTLLPTPMFLSALTAWAPEVPS